MLIEIKKIVFLLFFLLQTLVGFCANQFPDFRVVSPKGGFSFGSIHQISEDSHGFIWFGSHHGLFRDNTETIQKFVYIPSNTNSIPSNHITSITRDENGTMWFASDKGICFYNERKENFERCFFYDSNKEIIPDNTLQIISGDKNSLWILNDNSLYIANTETFSTDLVEVNPQDNQITFIYLDKEKCLWAKSSTGKLYRAIAPYTSFSFFSKVQNQPVLSMLFSKQKLWIGYEFAGADCYNNNGMLIGKYGNNRPNGFNIKSDRIRKIHEDQQGQIWFGTYSGIAILNNDSISFHDEKNTEGLMHSSIYDIFTDSKKGIWVSTWSGTLSYANPYDNAFGHINIKNGLSNNVVSSITEHKGLVWIGTEGGGLNSYNPVTGEILKHTLHTALNGVQNIKALEVDNNNTLWVGTFGEGLWILKNFDTKRHPRVIRKVMEGDFYYLYKDDRYIWAASYYKGLFRINTETLDYENFMGDTNDLNTVHNNHLRTLLVDSHRGLWVGTQSGMCYRKNGEKTFTRFFSNPIDTTSLSGNQIYSIFEDSNETIWIGTSSGLSRFNPETKNFVNFTPKNGMPGYEIYGITEDDQKNLWISTDNGITKFNHQKLKFRNFNDADGLQGNQFNPGAVFRSPQGEIYFGGPNGLSKFQPSQINTNTIAPNPVIIGMLINNQLQIPSDTSCIIEESVLWVNHYELKHDQNSITFQFVANNFLNAQKNNFSYRLLNYDNNWINSGPRKIATYTKIPPGKYIFQLKAANNDGIWNNTPSEITLIINAPWWKRWYAFVVYFIVFMGGALYVQRERVIKLNLLNDVYLEKIRSQSEQETNDAKLTFFTNISHEIKTPLSLILSPLDFIIEKRKNDAELIDVLKTIQRSGNRLKHLLYQVIDIRRLDAGKLSFTPGLYNLVPIIKELCNYFSIEARDREITFSFNCEFEALSTFIDPDKFDKTIFNLLTNAFKFVPNKGTVVVSLQEGLAPKPYLIGLPIQGEFVEIQILNSGSFIAQEEFPPIFDRFYQGKEFKKRGTGIGLNMVKEYILLHQGQIDVSSEIETGTAFTIRIPLIVEDNNRDKTPKQPTTTSGYLLAENNTNNDLLPKKDKCELVLIIEDDTELRHFLRKSLSDYFTIITASNGKQGVDQAMELNPDLIISDVMMPEMDGLEVCQRIKENINTSHIPVILLTALTSEEQKIEGYKIGADAYISKPFSNKLLLTQINNLLLNRQSLRKKFLDPDSLLINEDFNDIDLQLINKATSIVEQHLLDYSFTVETLAEKLKISRTSLHRKLKANTDQSATEFIRFIRLKKAIKMLRSNNYSIDEISYAVGFNTPSYFSQSFKKQFGKSPKEYLGKIER